MKKAWIILLVALGVVACNRNDEDVDKVGPDGTEFFPVRTGSTFVYKVDSIAYDDNGPVQAIDTFYYQYKEEVGDAFTDDAGRQAYEVRRYFRQDDSSDWRSVNRYTVQLSANTLQRVEENTRYVKMVFPLRDRLSWDGNMYNNLGFQAYRAQDYGQPYQFNGREVKSVRVQQWNVENFIEEIRRHEVYAEHIGMVELLFDSLNTQHTGTKGFRYRLRLVSHTP